jgi:hypothetical protein
MVSKNAQWAFIFSTFSKESLRQMLMRAAIKKDDGERVVFEFDGEQAMEISDHVKEMEDDL